MHKLLGDFAIQTYHTIPARRLDLVITDKKRKELVLGILPSQRAAEKIKENKKSRKYLDLAKELRKLWNMNVTVIPIVAGA